MREMSVLVPNFLICITFAMLYASVCMAVLFGSRMATSSLRQFQLNGVSDTGRLVGNGSYATVKEVEFRGLKCVGKKIHQLLFDAATHHEKTAMLQRFTEECELLSRLHHPCVVQFLGVYFEQGSQLPVLVMEHLHTTLSDCLAR